MKSMAIITSGGLPVPAVKGGAVETLVDLILKGNEKKPLYDIEVYSIYSEKAKEDATLFKHSRFEFIRINKKINNLVLLASKMLRKIFGVNICNEIIFLNQTKKKLKKKKYDYILIENRTDFVVPIKKIVSNRSKVIYHIHNSYLNHTNKNTVNVIKACDLIITVSDYLKNEILKNSQEDIDKSKVRTLQNCIDVSEFGFQKYKKFRSDFRTKHNITSTDIVIVFCGRINEVKGIRELLKAFNSLRRKDLKLLIIGSSWYDSKEVTPYYSEIQEISDKNKDNIFFTGFVPHEIISQYYAVGDLVVVPSLWEEPAGLVVLEGLASGIPLIVTRKGGIPEYSSNDNTIYIDVDEYLVANLAQQIQYLADDESLRKEMGENAIQFASYFNPENYYNEFCNLINEL